MKYVKGLVSVIIPTYKRSNTIERAVKSVIDQTYDLIECIVVNDNDKDDIYSSELIEKLQSYIDSNKVILLEQEHHKNGAAARNYGIVHSKGEYIAFLDDDDWWNEEKITKEVAFIKEQDEHCGVVSTLAIYYRNNKAVRKTRPYKSGMIYKSIMAREMDVITCSLLFKRSALDKIGYFDENLKRHQELQLLGYFTEKYSIMLLPEYLTYVSVDDPQNRPDANTLIQIKEDFFVAMEPIMMRMSISDRRYIKYMHKTELIYFHMKEKQFVKAVLEGIKLMTCPTAFILSIRRILFRIMETKACKDNHI